jgi:hypothetical protein
MTCEYSAEEMDAGGEDYVLNMDKVQIVYILMYHSIPINSKYLITLNTAPPDDRQLILNLDSRLWSLRRRRATLTENSRYQGGVICTRTGLYCFRRTAKCNKSIHKR